MKRITIKDLAKHLLISTSTVSRALVNDKNIHPETKAKVLEAVRTLGYKPNITALNLKYGQSKSIGFLVPEMTTPFSSKVLQGVQDILEPLGYRVIILQSDENPLIERKNLSLLEEFNVDGIILNICHDTYNTSIYEEMMAKGIPMVFFDRIPDKSVQAPKVIVNDFIKASLMVEHLISIGRKRIVHLVGPSTIRNAVERSLAYQQIMQKHGLYADSLLVKTEGMLFEHGKNAIQELMHKKVQFDAIFAFSDTLAIGAMNYLQEQQVKIPDEVAIASFSGTELATIVFPKLTSVEPPLFEMGQKAAYLMVEKINHASIDNKVLVLNAELVYRASTGM